MELEKLYKETIKLLNKESCEFVVCGGLAAMLYRHQIRFTGDIDFLLASNAIETATRIIEHFGLKAHVLCLAQLSLAPMANKKRSPVAVVVGRDESDKNAIGVDFLMPVQAWTKNAILRAKENIITIHNTSSPFITAEDVMLAKFSAVMASGNRREKDWDDIFSIIESGRKLDLAYLGAEIDRMKLYIPMEFEKRLPRALAVAFKRIRKERLNYGSKFKEQHEKKK